MPVESENPSTLVRERAQDFVDPRCDPEPPARVCREPAAHGEEIRELTALCSAGRVYEAERWIQDGRPIQALTYKRPKQSVLLSPLRASIRTKHENLVLLLLCNGYRLDLEDGDGDSVLSEALNVRAFDLLELLLKWGADPKRADTESILDTYSSELIDRFWKAGVDYTKDEVLVRTLAHSVNKPLYGWLRRNRSDPRLQDALDMALLEAVTSDQELTVSLLLWAGANPHRPAPSLREFGLPDAWDESALWSSTEAAIFFGRHRLLKRLRIDSMPNLEALATRAHDTWTLKEIVAVRPPSDWSEIIVASIHRLCWRHGLGSHWDAQDALRFAAASGGRLTSIPAEQVGYVRRELLDAPDRDYFLWLVKWLRKERNCEPEIYRELTRTRGMQEKLKALMGEERYLSPSQKMSRANDRRRRASERRKNAMLASSEGTDSSP